MRYEKQLPTINNDKEQLQALLKEYGEIRDELSAELQENQDSALYIDLIKLILRISDYFLASEEEVKKGVADVMGGTVLQLESERLLAEGVTQGTARFAKLVELLLAQNKVDEVKKVASDEKLREEYYVMYNI